MGTKANPGRFDCYANAGPDEPLFVLLARDKHAPTLLWLWSALRALDGEDAAVVDEARQCCEDMLRWAAAHGRRSVGLGQAALAGVLELIRTVNATPMPDAANDPTGFDTLRRWLAQTEFETATAAAPGTRPPTPDT